MSNVPERPDLVTELLHRVAQLERQVRAMSTEVRTRRLVVVDQHGHERIVGECRADLDTDPAELKVSSPDNQTAVSLTTDSDQGWNAGAFLYVAGNGVSMWSAQPREDLGVCDNVFFVGETKVAESLTDLRSGIGVGLCAEWDL